MSYCRQNEESDVYVYPAGDDDIVCCFCRLTGRPRFHATRRVMLDHLLEHRSLGEKVPEYALDRLRGEIANDG